MMRRRQVRETYSICPEGGRIIACGIVADDCGNRKQSMIEEAKSDEALKGQLRVTHKDEGDHLARGIKLALDGKDWTLLKSGKAIVREVEPGHHRLRIDNTFHTSNRSTHSG